MPAEAFGRLSGRCLQSRLAYAGPLSWGRLLLSCGRLRRVPTKRSLESCVREVQEFFAVEGKRPRCADLPNVVSYLRNFTDYTLGALCDEMNLPGGYCLGRTLEDCKEEVRKFFDLERRRPRSGELDPVAGWLRRHTNFTLKTFCDEMELPKLPPKNARTLATTVKEFQDFFQVHGRRPKVREVQAAAAWLGKAGYTLRILCDKEGIGVSGRNYARDLKACERKIREFSNRQGRRPAWNELRGEADWLRTNTDYTLGTLCDEMGLPR